MELLTVKQVISLRTLGNAQRTVWKIYIEIEKYVFFVLSRAWDKEKILSPHEESNLRPSDVSYDALTQNDRDSSVSEVYYEVHMTRVLHTARISNVDSVMFVDRNERDGKF